LLIQNEANAKQWSKVDFPIVKVSEIIGNTKISISYSQPTVNWRETWGKRVPFKKNWTIGNKEKTIITFEEDVEVNNIRLGAGTYGFYVYPVNHHDWQLVFSKDTIGTAEEYDNDDDMLRVSVVPEESSFQESLKMGIEKIEMENDQEAENYGGSEGVFYDKEVSNANLFLHWEMKRANLKLFLTGERRGDQNNPLNPNIPDNAAKAWKIVKSSLIALAKEDFIGHTDHFSDEFLTNYGDGGGKASYIQFLGHSYRSGDSEGITINLELMKTEISEARIRFNNILVYFQHGAVNYSYELIKNENNWLVDKIRVPSVEGGEI